ncbi:MAG: hypothetical protein P8J19_05050 [Acidimicrobiales bacterium]|nr:hypothetical protein [Acidimicrobiales bacterium]
MLLDGERVADLTSGSLFPTLDYRIALAFLPVDITVSLDGGAAPAVH